MSSDLVSSGIGTPNPTLPPLATVRHLSNVMLAIHTSHRSFQSPRFAFECSMYPSLSYLYKLFHVILTIIHQGLIDEETEAQRS